MWKQIVALALASFLQCMPANAQSSVSEPTRESKIVSAFMSLCPLFSDDAQRQAAQEEASRVGVVDHGPLFMHGPGGLAHEGSASIGDDALDVSTFAAPGGYCLVRFAPAEPSAMQGLLEARLGAPNNKTADYSLWSLQRADGETEIIYRPYASGQSGPVWVGRGEGYRFGPDAAEVKDMLIFYPPEGPPSAQK